MDDPKSPSASRLAESTLDEQEMTNTKHPDVCEQCFIEVFDFIHIQARNKRLRLQMENKEMALRIKRLNDERTSTVGSVMLLTETRSCRLLNDKTMMKSWM
ncbi:hypothetical protein HJC23_005578 [Cyclotella cryptica]|uniref:Uncharacterized protein n=1 Tax=Cyclotella cryptica TaxID=29204 RepID=A0ABD3PSF5_9STRA